MLRLIVAVSGEDEEFIAIFLIRSKNLIQHLGIVVHGETRDQDADKFGLSVRENFCHFVFFIVQFIQCIGNDLLIFRCQGIGLLKYREMVVLEKCVYCAISLKVTFFFSCHKFKCPSLQKCCVNHVSFQKKTNNI